MPPSVRLPAFVCPFCLPLQGWGGAMRKISKEKKKDRVATYLHRVSVVIVVAQEPIVVCGRLPDGSLVSPWGVQWLHR